MIHMRQEMIYTNKQILKIAREVSVKINRPLDVVLLAYKSYWDNIKNNIENSDFANFKDGDNPEFPLSYSIQFIGKLSANINAISIINNNIKNKKKINEVD